MNGLSSSINLMFAYWRGSGWLLRQSYDFITFKNKFRLLEKFLKVEVFFIPCLENREYGCRDPSPWPCGTLYPQKLALTSPTSGGRSVCIVRSRTQTTEFVFSFLFVLYSNHSVVSTQEGRVCLGLTWVSDPDSRLNMLHQAAEVNVSGFFV
jgi:hypothetical protein